MTKSVFCILYAGLPIEGFSTDSGYPIFSTHDKFLPSMHFNTYSQAQETLHLLVLGTLDIKGNAVFEHEKISIGMIEVKINEGAKTSVYDDSIDRISINSYSTQAQKDRNISKIIHKCVREGFRKILPIRHNDIITRPEFAELYDKNVPYFVQQNIERFMDVGIDTCTPDEIAAIILTSSDELLEAIQIDSLNNVSK